MNDKTKLVKEAKNDKGSRCCWSAYQKKRLGEMGLSEMKLGEMRLGEMLPNHIILSSSSSRFILPSSLNVCIRYLKILSAGLIKFR